RVSSMSRTRSPGTGLAARRSESKSRLVIVLPLVRSFPDWRQRRLTPPGPARGATCAGLGAGGCEPQLRRARAPGRSAPATVPPIRKASGFPDPARTGAPRPPSAAPIPAPAARRTAEPPARLAFSDALRLDAVRRGGGARG